MSEGRDRGPRAGQRLRGKVRGSDEENVRRVLESAGNFYHCEIDIAIELLDDYRQSGNKSPYQFIFADRGSEFAGFICYGEIPLTEGSYDIYWIAVRKDIQNRGTGKALLAAAEKKILAAKGSRVYVDTSSRPDYHDTHMFYERCGYGSVARIPDFYRDEDDKVVYAKRLKAKG